MIVPELPEDFRGRAASVLIGHDGNSYKIVPIDRTSGSLYTIEGPHHETHDGHHFTASDTGTVTVGNTIDYAFIAGNYPAHLLTQLTTDGKAFLRIYEQAVDVTGGSAVPIINRNRMSSTVSGVSVLKAPTVTLGQLLLVGMAGANSRAGGDNRAEDEILLKPNTQYVFRVTAAVNIEYVLTLSWYSHIE